MKKKVIAYLHTHWDREWYREFEVFRMRLLRVFDEIIDALEADLIPSFYFDGQIVALLDYLEMRPQNEQRVRALIKSKKLFIGPFYCLIDEFLTSETLFRKNLEYGLDIARSFGCEDFTGYLPDTFGHSDGVIAILKEFGLEQAIVWRGCPSELPAEFIWKDNNGNCIDGVNLVRGYFMDIFTSGLAIEKKVEFLKTNLDKISEKSGDVLLLPIGADHLGIPLDIKEQINKVNSLLDDYEIELGTIFDYISAVKENHNIEHFGELRDNSQTFTLEGSYSARADLKQLNVLATYELSRAEKLVSYFKLNEKYDLLIKYAYKLLLQNQAHDSICGCSTDDTHYENILRYKKINQISKTIISEIKHSSFVSDGILDLSKVPFCGVVERTKYEISKDDIVFNKKNGFKEDLLVDIRRIPITEDYQAIYTTLDYIENSKVSKVYDKIEITETTLNDVIVVDDVVKYKDIEIYPRDFKDYGDSYNRGVVSDDAGQKLKIKSCRNIFNSPLRGVLSVEYEDGSVLDITCDFRSDFIKLDYTLDNQKDNHHLFLCMNYASPITTTLSEDMNRIIKRKFNPDYDIRKNLPEKKGLEAPTNTAPCQRLVWANGYGAVLKGVNQYEVQGTELRLSLLRATGIISTPSNSTRTTPAGPPISTIDSQLRKKISQELYVFTSSGDDLKEKISKVYNYLYV